ncbi:efflux RND transporter periplasmic adaptor subunit [Anatilimnocola floriformis]|uniref:efflux RND transporter periplasmic adaptor subunit n=1 Tax=Anatilimnocola floriformis TaxID=2948575 RepID=UPI0020C5777F|nr:efflux RND transporter periplasmic adaptor subunit [Anatilimnocola floriformis]
MRLAFLLLAGAAAVAASGCGSAAGNLPTPQPPKVTVAVPAVREVRDIDDYTGRIESTQTVEVHARVGGILDEVYFADGDFVERGKVLYQIDPRTYRAEWDQAKARVTLYDAKYNLARTIRARNESLLKAKAVAQEEFDQSVASEAEALAARESALADTETMRLNLEFTQIKAEISGRIDRTYITRGNMVQAGALSPVLTKIVSVDPVYVYFNPDEIAFLRYTERRVAGDGKMEATHLRERKIVVTITLADGTTYSEAGLIDFASNTVDPSTGTITVRASFPNPKRALTPGLFVRLHIASEDAYQAVLIPERAINTDQSDKFVYVINDKNIAERRNVVLGTKHGKLRVVKSGLGASDRVVISGGLLVRAGLPVTPEEGAVDISSLPALPKPPTAMENSEPAKPAPPPELPIQAAPDRTPPPIVPDTPAKPLPPPSANP